MILSEYSFLLILLALILTSPAAWSSSAIGHCPPLTPRFNGPQDVTDLRPDDIKVVGALGDSIMAGLFMGGKTPGASLLGKSTFTETRGRSWGIGGDPGALTLANFIKNYNSSLEGASKGNHIPEWCNGRVCLDFYRFPKKDVLNAALSGAIAMNLDDELDYLVKVLKSLRRVRYETDWKMITIQIGSNDLCSTCKSPWTKEVTPEKYAFYVDKAIQRIKTEIPRTIVNLVGVFDFVDIYQMTSNQPRCKGLLDLKLLQMSRIECPCFRGSELDRENMHSIAKAYNEKLIQIYNKYKRRQSNTFGVAWQPANIDFQSVPLSALSNADCFHPTDVLHEYFAKTIWRHMFTRPSEKPDTYTYRADSEVYCPTDNDRIWV